MANLMWWCKCTDETSELLITFDSSGSTKQMQDSFVAAAAKAETESIGSLTIKVNEEGQQRIEEAKANIIKATPA